MFKKYILLFLMLLTATLVHAQEHKTAYEDYVDFNLLRFQGDTPNALDAGVALLDSVDKLPPKSRISFYNSMGKLYEDNRQPERAAPYYEKVVAAVPNYYVAHRALGYIYLTPANELSAKLNGKKSNDPTFKTLKAQYLAAATKALKHLEMAQACDPSDETLDTIKVLYKNMGDTAGLNSLDARLKAMSKDCLDILSDN
jgi:tetratricopeptide (TPR) repeat protein